MLTQILISDIELIDLLRNRFTLIDKDNVNWTETYVDNETSDKWLYYRVDTELQGAGFPILAKQPLPDTNHLIQLSLNSQCDDEVFAACRTLVDNEQIKRIDFREHLINALESICDSQRQNRIIELTGLDNALNKRDILGKSFEKVNDDAAYFKNIADRASKLKRDK